MGHFQPLYDLTIKLLVGGLQFVAAVYIALGIRFAVGYAEHHLGAPVWLAKSADWVEIAIWAGDAVIVLLYIARDHVTTAGQIWRGDSHD